MPVHDYIQPLETLPGAAAEEVARRFAPGVLDRVVRPTEQDLDNEEQRQTARSGSTYATVLSPANVTEGVSRLIGSQNLKAQRAHKIGFQPFMVINLMPFPLELNSCIHRKYNLKVSPAPLKRRDDGLPAYSYLPLNHLYWESQDKGAGMDGIDNYEAMEYQPIEIAEPFIQEFVEIQKVGGVFIYGGDRLPETFAEGTPIRHAMQQAREARNQWCAAQHEKALLMHATENQRKQITDIHRDAWRVLLLEGKVSESEKPPYLAIITNTAGQAPEFCKACGAPRNGYMCACGNYVYDPIAAYTDAMIPFGHPSFQKLDDAGMAAVIKIKAERDQRDERLGLSGKKK